MKKIVVIVLMAIGMVSVAQARMVNTSGGGISRAEACSSAKSNAADIVRPGSGSEIVSFGSCDCSETRRDPDPYWTCGVDFRVENARGRRQPLPDITNMPQEPVYVLPGYH